MLHITCEATSTLPQAVRARALMHSDLLDRPPCFVLLPQPKAARRTGRNTRSESMPQVPFDSTTTYQAFHDGKVRITPGLKCLPGVQARTKPSEMWIDCTCYFRAFH